MAQAKAKTGPRPSRDERIMMALVRVAELFKRRSAAVFREHGLSFSQYNALRVLWSLPGGRAGLSEVGRRILVSKHNLSGIAKRLEAGGFVRRLESPQDERLRLVALTAKGRQVLLAIAEAQEANVQQMLAPYSLEEREALLRVLRDMLSRP
ncbi:MAG: MarR family transcriptional regulator [Desulfarculaceae bacterium]|nr:MarR family transcriptional regulator [Desulfarculaceae bacterium]